MILKVVRSVLTIFLLTIFFPADLLVGQQPDADQKIQPGTLKESGDSAPSDATEHKRLFGIVPNYRSARIPVPYQALTPGEKFKIASQDAFDRGTFILAAAFAGEGQLSRSNPEFGNGASAYGKYLGTAYADFVIGDYMTEALFPTVLHQDPRYFARLKGSAMSRLGYAVEQIFWTHSDTGRGAFNYSELAGNATSVAISNAYYTSNRNASDNLVKWGSQIGVDMASNVLKEFSSDVYRKFSRKH